jgi:hypothetical protein
MNFFPNVPQPSGVVIKKMVLILVIFIEIPCIKLFFVYETYSPQVLYELGGILSIV